MATSVDCAQQEAHDMGNATQQTPTVTISSEVRVTAESRQETQRQQSEMLIYCTDGSLQPLHLRYAAESSSQPQNAAGQYDHHDHTESRTSELVTGITITLSTTNSRSFVRQETNPLFSGVMLCGYFEVEVHRRRSHV